MHFLSPIEIFKRNPLTHHSSLRFLRPSNSCSWIQTSRILMFFPLVLLSVHVKRSAIGNELCTSCILCLQDVYLDDFKWSIFWGFTIGWLFCWLNFLKLKESPSSKVFLKMVLPFPKVGYIDSLDSIFTEIFDSIPFEVIGIWDPCCFICWKLLLCKRTSSLLTHKYQLYDLRSLTARPWKIMVGIQSFPIGMVILQGLC